MEIMDTINYPEFNNNPLRKERRTIAADYRVARISGGRTINNGESR